MTRQWDSAEHLQTDEDMAAYLDAALDEAGGDPEFGTILNHLCAWGQAERLRGMTDPPFGRVAEVTLTDSDFRHDAGIFASAYVWPSFPRKRESILP